MRSGKIGPVAVYGRILRRATSNFESAASTNSAIRADDGIYHAVPLAEPPASGTTTRSGQTAYGAEWIARLRPVP